MPRLVLRALLAALIALAGVPLLPAAPAAAADPVKVMLLGDSITEGLTEDPPGTYASNLTLPTYRYYLWNSLTTAGADFDYVGTQSGTANLVGPYPTPDVDTPITVDPLGLGSWDQDHEGHQGWRADQLLDGFFFGAGTLTNWLDTHTPDVVVLNIGANDIIQFHTPADIHGEIQQIIAQVRAENANADIVVMTLVDLTHPDNPSAQTMVDTLNGLIRTLPASHNTANSRVIVADVAAGYNNATMNSDGIHPNTTGQIHIANIVSATLLSNNLLDPPNTPPTAGISESCNDLTCSFSSAGSSDPDGSIASRSWNFGDGSTSTAANPTHAYASGGTYTVSLTVTDNDGGTGSTSKSITVTAPACTGGYTLVEQDGQIYPFGNAANYGAPSAGVALIDIQATPTGCGYWTLRANGQVEAFGDATALGNFNLGALGAGETLNSFSATASGNGLWGFTSRGRVLRLGDATDHGDLLHLTLNGPVIDSVITPTGDGYYMLGSDGGIFTFGNADYSGSVPGLGITQLAAPAVGIVPDPDGSGYWIVAADGGVFSFDAPFRGSFPALNIGSLNQPIVGMVPYGNGYLQVASDGGVFNFSNLPFDGSIGNNPPNTPVVAITPLP